MSKNCIFPESFSSADSSFSTQPTVDNDQKPPQKENDQLYGKQYNVSTGFKCGDFYDPYLWLPDLFNYDSQQTSNLNFGNDFNYEDLQEEKIDQNEELNTQLMNLQYYYSPQILNQQQNQFSSQMNEVDQHQNTNEDSFTNNVKNKPNLYDSQSISKQSNSHEGNQQESQSLTTASSYTNFKQKRKAKEDSIIQQLRCYQNGLIFDQQILNIYNRINNIYDDLYPQNQDEKKQVLITFVQLFNENRYKFNYKNVRYLFQDFQFHQIEEKDCMQELKLMIKIFKNKCVIKILELINRSKQIYKEFFRYFIENELIKYLYNEYKTKTYPNKDYNNYIFRQVDIQFTLYFIQSLFIDNF
ncbi:hypothetical protein ABPG74_004461 [Tetrahymena malaccensis]